MEGTPTKKAKLRTSEDVFNRLKWDESINSENYVIGYLDRFDGLQEIALNEFVTTDLGGDIPFHRIYYFRDGEEIVWDRRTRYDKVFGSGEVAKEDDTDESNDIASELNVEEGETVEGMHKIQIVGPETDTSGEMYKTMHVIDITPQSLDPRWVKFSALYPHGKIPVPLCKASYSQTLEGIWQALKVFENEGVDIVKLRIKTGKGLDRQANGKRGRFKGFSQGVPKSKGKTQMLMTAELWSEHEARAKLWIPCYRWILDNCLQDEIAELRKLAQEKPLVIVDARSNQDVDDVSQPLGVACILKSYLLRGQLNVATATTTALPQRQRHQRARAAQPKESAAEPKEENLEGLPEARSCGVILFCDVGGAKYFLLMQHRNRLDLPKGHVDGNETDLETAYREMEEETGIKRTQVEIDPTFDYVEVYYPTYRKKLGGGRVKKTLHIFLARIPPIAGSEGEKALPPITVTEHVGYQWVKWNPPHSIQKLTIDPLLKTVEEHFATGKVADKEESEEEDEDEEEAEEGEAEVSDTGSQVSGSDKETGKRRQKKQQQKQFEANKANVAQDKGKPAGKARRRRNQMVEGGGYALLDKCTTEGGKGKVGIYDEQITFSEKALDTQAKLILKRNYKANVSLDSKVHKYEGDENDSEEEQETEEDKEIREMYTKPQDRKTGTGLSDYLSAEQQEQVAITAAAAVGPGGGAEWACGACTFLNKPAHLACSVCATPKVSTQ